MSWQCAKCCELIEEPFDACWNCGKWRSGQRNRAFRRADRVRPESLVQEERATIALPPAKFQFSVRGLLMLTTLFAIACMIGSIWWELAWFVAIWTVAMVSAMLLMGLAIHFLYDVADAIRNRRRQ